MRSESLHFTLCFLGYVAERAIPRIGEAMREARPARPVVMRLEPAPTPLPKGRPALYAIGARGDRAIEVQANLSAALETRRLYRPEKRAYWPHLTVARVRSERLAPEPGRRRGRGRPRRVARPPGGLPEPLLEPFEAVRIALYRSILRPQGAEYSRLDGVDLPTALAPAARKR